ncbi:PQQ-like beta-propeller repeat protein [Tuwongella immobilis]|uniref:Pyrrolo-quinoline quinone repeat domain-containing protein n=1 Tax=Tuwongella immobilis TaxID=692036 RepID=A0A6C2YT24_9BACT|nr:PQQ-like beta-propeller repeat protein [Tuwongella immobilis]VIP04888.1 Pyrrolo-quinoline quinone OS=Pedosphaera parvula (strain Ellin514) GN=Cflav_PD4382 PE=4 SV=1: PQQ_2 [Tuwongella immobilis]VTS07135.1 Pyrrolo-quinoline quinone OS=Pedosphaera parvula (strain Ellin514) GN=Cflav_PD4382 PE=4 SV=1: PQQ_2 [Tuwongella immobilis]
MRAFVLAGWLALVSPWAVSAADWPQWLGPNRNGISTETIAPWTGPLKPSWSVSVGEGHSSPVVAAGKIFVHSKVAGQEAERVQAFELATGKPIWEKTYTRPAFTSPFGLGPRSTPAVSGETLITLGSTGILTAWKTTDGSQLWQIDTAKQFDAPKLTFGVSTSPLVLGNQVIVNVGAKGASMVSFSLTDGAVIWKCRSDPASYSSPVLLELDGKPQLVALTGSHVIGLNPENGTVLWEQPFKDLLNESSTTPVKVGDLLIATSVTVGSIGLSIDLDGKPSPVKQLWKSPVLTSYFTTPVPFAGNTLLMVTGQIIPPPTATLRCVDVVTGKELWKRKPVGKYHATLIGLGNGEVLMLEETGDLVLIAANSKEYTEKARAKRICGETWAHPALVDGTLIVRTANSLFALPLK